MNFSKQFSILLLSSTVLFFSCKKYEPKPEEKKEVDVYVVGNQVDLDLGSIVYEKKAFLWKNGTGQELSGADPLSFATSIFVSGNDTYVSGDEIFYQGLMFWKNGDLIQFDRSIAGLESDIFIANGDIYLSASIVGNDAYYPTYWKNGASFPLEANSSATTTGIYVSGNDVYVSGKELKSDEIIEAVYWKNGVRVSLPKFRQDAESTITTGIYVSGNDVYVSGYEKYPMENYKSRRYPIYWKNGVPVKLTDSEGEAKSVFVSGSDVYIGGNEISEGKTSIAVYWKNGSRVTLTDGKQNAVINSIKVFEKDVYAAGYETKVVYLGTHEGDEGLEELHEPRSFAKYWKNGSPVVLGNWISEATDIFIVERPK